MEENKQTLHEDLNNNAMKYISVVFYDKLSGEYCSQEYTYKTRKDLKKGQLLEVATPYGVSKVAVYNENVDPSTITFDLNKIKEI